MYAREREGRFPRVVLELHVDRVLFTDGVQVLKIAVAALLRA